MEKLLELIDFLKTKGLENKKIDISVLCGIIEYFGKQAEFKQLCMADFKSRFNSDTFIDDVCLSYRHDFGLMSEQDRQTLRFECKEWMSAIINNWY